MLTANMEILNVVVVATVKSRSQKSRAATVSNDWSVAASFNRVGIFTLVVFCLFVCVTPANIRQDEIKVSII